MRIVIYNSSSFGGCYDYGRALTLAYAESPDVESVTWLVPTNAADVVEGKTRRLFLSDRPATSSKTGKQLQFLWRVLANPLKLLFALRKQPPSWIIFNDFEQLTALIWVPLYRLLLGKKHGFAVLLHDPDRDAYPPNLWFTTISMRSLIGLMDVAIYHDFLPQKAYYQKAKRCRFIDLPHGFYSMPAPDPAMFQHVSQFVSEHTTLVAILGNIRPEKNYDLAIEALKQLPNHRLIIAGSAANARVNIQKYKDMASQLGVANRVFWIEKFLTEAEMSAVIEVIDVVLLNYATSFTSQSGILNVVAPFRKELIVSDGPSSLATLLRKFKVGKLVEPQSVSSLVHALEKLESEGLEVRHQWEEYLAYASWKNHVARALHHFKNTRPDL